MKNLLKNKQALLGFIMLSLFLIGAIFAPLLTSVDPDKRVGRKFQDPCWMDDRSCEKGGMLGTSNSGHDLYAQFLYGGRISIAVGVTAGLITTVIALLTGISAGFIGGRTDDVITFVTNVVLVIPQLPLLLVLAAFIGQINPFLIAMLIGFTSWAWGSRVIRAQTLALKEKEFIQAALLIGESKFRIIIFELLPNLVTIVGSGFIGAVIYAMMTEATIEFIGLGDPSSITWGIMLNKALGAQAVFLEAWWAIVIPCAAISLFGASLALINFAVDEISNPKLRSGKGLRRWKKLNKQAQKQRPSLVVEDQ